MAADAPGKLVTSDLGLCCVVLVTRVPERHAKQCLPLTFIAKNAERLLPREEVITELLHLSSQLSGGAKPLLTGLVVIFYLDIGQYLGPTQMLQE